MTEPERPLSPRQLEVLALYVEGFTLADTAYALGILYHTASVQLREARMKFPVGTKGHEMVRWAVAHGVVSVEFKRLMKRLVEEGPEPL